MRQSTAFIIVLALCACTCIDLQGQESAGGYVSCHGKELVSPDGHPIILRGISLGNWLVPEGYMFKFEKGAESPRKINEVMTELIGPEETAAFWKAFRERYITRDDIHFIKKIGLNSVRVPFNFRLFTNEEEPAEWKETGFELLDRVVGWCREEGVWVILDMHCAPGGQTGDNIDDSWGYPWLFRNPGLQQRTIDLWTRIAARYKDEPIVIGYDLLNEPIAPYFDTTALNGMLEPFYKRLVASIRTVDPHHVIILGGAQWDGNFRIFGPPFDRNLAYTFHKYWTDTTQSVIQDYVDFRERFDVPIWLGESGENTDQWIAGFRNLQEKNGIGWCFWPYKKPEAKTCLVTFQLPEGYDAIKAYAESPRADYGQIREAMPDREKIRRVLREYLENCLFTRCTVNEGYATALGVTAR